MRIALAALLALLSLPASAGAQAGKPVVGGGSFNTAPLLNPGRYSDTVAAGETVYWKVRLQKGQILQVKATVDTSQLQTDVTKSDYKSGLVNLNYRMSIHTPLREDLSNEAGSEYQDATTTLEGATDAGAKTGTVKSSRVLGFEQILAGDYTANKFPGPGEWYIALSAADSAADPAEVPAEFPVDLEVEFLGAPQPSSPDFAAKLPSATPTPESTREPDPGAVIGNGNSGAGDPTLTIALVAAIALAGGLILGVLAALVLGLGRLVARRT